MSSAPRMVRGLGGSEYGWGLWGGWLSADGKIVRVLGTWPSPVPSLLCELVQGAWLLWASFLHLTITNSLVQPFIQHLLIKWLLFARHWGERNKTWSLPLRNSESRGERQT